MELNLFQHNFSLKKLVSFVIPAVYTKFSYRNIFKYQWRIGGRKYSP